MHDHALEYARSAEAWQRLAQCLPPVVRRTLAAPASAFQAKLARCSNHGTGYIRAMRRVAVVQVVYGGARVRAKTRFHPSTIAAGCLAPSDIVQAIHHLDA